MSKPGKLTWFVENKQTNVHKTARVNDPESLVFIIFVLYTFYYSEQFPPHLKRALYLFVHSNGAN